MSLALDKEAGFAECRTEHSAKSLTWGPSLAGSLPSASGKTLGKDAVSVTHHRNNHLSLPSAREKVLGKEGFADALFAETSLPSVTLGKAFAECHTRQSLCWVFLRICRVLRPLGKAPISGSVTSTERRFLKLKYFCELFKVNNDLREVKWFGDYMYWKEVIGWDWS
jgi:hypothetical protein